jgi:hypothetical protein
VFWKNDPTVNAEERPMVPMAIVPSVLTRTLTVVPEPLFQPAIALATLVPGLNLDDNVAEQVAKLEPGLVVN